MISVFGGTAAYHLDLSKFAIVGETVELDTPFGKSVPFTYLKPPGEKKKSVWFASRHGRGSLSRSARFVNQHANVWAARELGCAAILSWNGVGAIQPNLQVNDLVVPGDLLDLTRSRRAEFGMRNSGRLTELPRELVLPPFSELHRQSLIEGAQVSVQSPISDLQSQISIHQSAVYVCTEGPRLETPAEIRAYRQLGADVVGMTLSPEVWLAAELGLGYASLCYVTNIAAGLVGAERNFGPQVGEKCLEIMLQAALL